MKSTRTLAMYLPQFHEVPENSQWWGAGYTEWTVFASGEIRQIASVEKRQFGSAEIRQFESIEKSQS